MLARDREVCAKLKNAGPMVGKFEQYKKSRALSQGLGSLTPNFCFLSVPTYPVAAPRSPHLGHNIDRRPRESDCVTLSACMFVDDMLSRIRRETVFLFSPAFCTQPAVCILHFVLTDWSNIWQYRIDFLQGVFHALFIPVPIGLCSYKNVLVIWGKPVENRSVQNADWVQNEDWQEKLLFFVRNVVTFYCISYLLSRFSHVSYADQIAILALKVWNGAKNELKEFFFTSFKLHVSTEI